MPRKKRLLDLFCGAGGAAAGYHMAGFEVVGVDINEQPRFPFEFIRGDALEYCRDFGGDFDLIHASPPCQRYSIANRGLGNADEKADLVANTRETLRCVGVDYVIENVFGAPLEFPSMLCGSMFGLGCSAGWLRRHRFFEMSRFVLCPTCAHKKGVSVGVYGNGTNSWHREKLGRNIRFSEQKEAMGIDWMTRKELSQAIPPAYTRFLGRQLLAKIKEA